MSSATAMQRRKQRKKDRRRPVLIEDDEEVSSYDRNTAKSKSKNKTKVKILPNPLLEALPEERIQAIRKEHMPNKYRADRKHLDAKGNRSTDIGTKQLKKKQYNIRQPENSSASAMNNEAIEMADMKLLEEKKGDEAHSGSEVGSSRDTFKRRPHTFPPLDLKRAPGHDTAKYGPKYMLFSCMYNNLLEVNLIDQTFKPDLALLFDWIDDGELTEGHCMKRSASEMWKPYLQFGNLIEEAQEIEKNTDVYKLDGRPVICHYRRVILGLCQVMPLKEFPFDIMNLDIECQFGWTTKDLRVVPGEFEVDPKIKALNEYVLIDNQIIVQEHLYEYYTVYDDSDDPYPEVLIRLTLARNPWYYIMRLVMPQLLLSIMELTSFISEPDAIVDRFSISGTIVLSEIALYFVAVQMLPRVPYVMRIDIWFTWCFMLVFASWGENTLIYKLSQDGNYTPEELASFDEWGAIIYSAGVFLGTVWFMIPLVKFQLKYARQQTIVSKIKKTKKDKADKKKKKNDN